MGISDLVIEETGPSGPESTLVVKSPRPLPVETMARSKVVAEIRRRVEPFMGAQVNAVLGLAIEEELRKFWEDLDRLASAGRPRSPMPNAFEFIRRRILGEP